MPKLFDLVHPADLDHAIRAGLIDVRKHPDLPLAIYNYSNMAQYRQNWTPVIRTCRGLIVDLDTDDVIARPWDKFMNRGQPGADKIAMNDPVEVTDKVDGSLGILYPDGTGGHAIATRGSFTSDQARHATALYKERYEGTWTPDPAYTYLFEIVFPANRMVLNYGRLDDLVLLGGRHTENGGLLGPADFPEWPGRRAETFAYTTLAEALVAPPRPNAEGLVVRSLKIAGGIVKIKQDDYVALHKIVFGMNERAVWERLGAGETVADVCSNLPDEFHPWVIDVATGLLMRFVEHLTTTREITAGLLAIPELARNRKAFAVAAKHFDCWDWIFDHSDGIDITGAIWKSLRPVAPRPMAYTQEAA